MFHEFPKNSILEISFVRVPANLASGKFMFRVVISAMKPNALGLDILSVNKEYIIILNGAKTHESLPDSDTISSSDLSIRDRIFKPLSNLSHTDISYISLFNYRAARVILKYLGLKLPKEVDSLKAFKKYIKKNRG